MSSIRHVAVMYGGPSAEHEVSCSSALSIIRALDPERFAPIAIGITRERGFVLTPSHVVEELRTPPTGGLAIEDRLPVTGIEVELRGTPDGRLEISELGKPQDVLAEADLVFPALHGPFGEDGVLQGVLETLGVPYAGNGVRASAVGMDKVNMKQAFIAEGIPITPHRWFDAGSWAAAPDDAAKAALVADLTFPLFVKPASMGSSIGISRIESVNELAAAVEEALTHDFRVIVEQGVTGRELECSVLGGFQPEASPVGEVTVHGGWFDYQQKYHGTEDPMIVPAVLSETVAEEVRALSLAAFSAVGCWGLARVDFLYDEEAGTVFVNELNTLPGFTAHSMYPKLWNAVGLDYPSLIGRLIDLADERAALAVRMATPAAPDA
ncbi:D-alanine--D-alanine ligase family protein [Nocardioides speluncae]|uniref:D-alanine--D-alanine ligase family protein n=1 Tax=Nocardioides speluncae TaxID=2670337 RepID=UPI000D6893E5|nr:D-alanine--D-alanine ligase family protein [Nocardioides speluncae]